MMFEIKYACAIPIYRYTNNMEVFLYIALSLKRILLAHICLSASSSLYRQILYFSFF